MFDKKIMLPHQYLYPHMDLFSDRCRYDLREQYIELIQKHHEKRRAIIYIHIPYCDSKCSFCGFDKQYNVTDMDQYVDKVISELRMYAFDYFEVEGVHLGGGTPTLLSGKNLTKIVRAVKDYFQLTKDITINIEGSCTSLYREDIIQFILDEKIAKVSTGIQTFNPKLRKIFNQKATLDEVYYTLEVLKKHNIIVHGDILYGYPHFNIGEQIDIVKEDLQEAIRMELDGIGFSHVFPYSNCLENMIEQEQYPMPTVEYILGIMKQGKEMLEKAGYKRETCYCYLKKGKIMVETDYYGGLKKTPDCIAVGSGAFGSVCGYKYRNNAFNSYMANELPCFSQLKKLTLEENENTAIVAWPRVFSLEKQLLNDNTKERFGPVLDFLKRHEIIEEQEERYELVEEAKFYVDNVYYMMLPEEERAVVDRQLDILLMEREKNAGIPWNARNWEI